MLLNYCIVLLCHWFCIFHFTFCLCMFLIFFVSLLFLYFFFGLFLLIHTNSRLYLRILMVSQSRGGQCLATRRWNYSRHAPCMRFDVLLLKCFRIWLCQKQSFTTYLEANEHLKRIKWCHMCFDALFFIAFVFRPPVPPTARSHVPCTRST